MSQGDEVSITATVAEYFDKTELTDIKGIGKLTAELLLQEFGSVLKIKKLEKEAIANTIGQAKAEIVFKYFKNKA